MNTEFTAIITGASAGLGKEFVRETVKQHPEISEIWLIARRAEKMQELASEFPEKSFKILALDLSNTESFDAYKAALDEAKPNVKLLINNSGFGKLGDFDSLSTESQTGMVDVNIRALVAMTSLTLPYMKEKSVILNVCSIASFIPNPRMAVYCSTKAFVLSFTKALRQELKTRKINVLAACPGPMETEFLAVADITKGKSDLFDFCPRVGINEMAAKSLKHAFNGKAVYTNKLIYKVYRVLGKLVPHNWLMWKFTA